MRQFPAMLSQLQAAIEGRVTAEMKAVGGAEGIPTDLLLEGLVEGCIAIMHREGRALGIGKGLRTKVNVNIGTSDARASLQDELRKARIAGRFGADTLSDLSMGGSIGTVRREIFRCTRLPITTVPVYETAATLGIDRMKPEDIVGTIEAQAAEGVSSMVLHFVDWKVLDALFEEKRTLGLVSKGGCITAAYMLQNSCENPIVEHLDQILAILGRYDIVLSLGNSARAGCISDRPDRAQQEELRMNAEIARYAHEKGVQVIIEGAGGHIRYDRIPAQVRAYKQASPFPLFVAGPLPLDIALGYDHIAACAGAAAASAAGADYLCCITPAEHLGLPSPRDVRDGLIACRIGAHIGDTVKLGREEPDREISRRRACLDRQAQLAYAIDPNRVRSRLTGEPRCTMCGKFCAIELMNRYFGRGEAAPGPRSREIE